MHNGEYKFGFLQVMGGTMRLEWIDDILAVLDNGSLVRAAERRFLTQSAFTRRVRLIEDSIGFELFDRRRKPVTLLPGVEALAPELRDLSARLRRLRQSLKSAASQTRESLSFGCQHAITTTVSPWIVRSLTLKTDASVRVRSGNQDECLMQLLAGEIDFAVMYALPDEHPPLITRAFESTLIGLDELIPVCAPSLQHLDICGPIPAVSYPSDVFLGQVFDRKIAPRLNEATTIITKAETALTLAACQYALGEIGIAWLPHSLVMDGLAQGELVRLDDALPAQALDIRILRLSEGHSAPSDALWRDVLCDMELPAPLQRLPTDLP